MFCNLLYISELTFINTTKVVQNENLIIFICIFANGKITTQ